MATASNVQLRIATISEIAEYISIESIEMPTDGNGDGGSEAARRYIYYPRPLFSWLQTPQTNAFEPTTYQTVELRNRGEETIHVLCHQPTRDEKW